ncbi:MAG: hypothetical protein HYZ33_00520 [Ignavibacteriales bacterium]|nr:hypothetical protein [Ignavibacteriales bacterium]
MVTAKAKIHTFENGTAIIPLSIPELDEVRKFATQVHARGIAWQDEFFGWQAEYNPRGSSVPIDSLMSFTPADFCIGESGFWFFSLMWEHGDNEEPVEFVDVRNIVESLTV